MFMRILLVILYLICVFIGARIADVGLSFIKVTSLSSVINEAVSDVFFSLPIWQFNDVQQSKAEQHNTVVNHRENSSTSDEFTNTLGLDKDSKNDPHIVELNSYEHFIEYVEDTKASVWVILVKSGKRVQINEDYSGFGYKYLNNWNILLKTLHSNGIRTGVYDCGQDEILCSKFNINKHSILLTMPAELIPKGQIAIHIYNNESICLQSNHQENKDVKCLLAWIKSKLRSKVLMLDSLEELVSLDKNNSSNHIGLNLVYKSSHINPPLLFSSLSVKFTGRINFVQFKSLPKEIHRENLLEIVNDKPQIYYSYGLKQGEEIEYSKIELFLKTLYPEINDIFFLAIIFINMVCWLEIFVQKGGPLKRFIYFFWTFTVSNFLLFFVWLPLTRLLQLPEAKPLVDFFLKSLQTAMFSNIASMIRKDLLLLSHHFQIFCFGLLAYGFLIAYLKFKLVNRNAEWPNILTLLNEDVLEVQQFLYSLVDLATPSLSYYNFEEQLENLLNHLARPSLWLRPLHCRDYIQQLVSWKFCKHHFQCSKKKKHPCTCKSVNYQHESSIVKVTECVICLEKFSCGNRVKLLPCKHFFHNVCIENWLLSGNSANNQRCPICRFPANFKETNNSV
eukprot:gene5493-6178_t